MRNKNLVASVALAFVAMLVIAGCAANTSGSTTTSTAIASVSVSCAGGSCAAQTNATLQLTGAVTCVSAGNCNTAVAAWDICTGTASAPTGCVQSGNSTLGVIDNNGLYTAPATVPSGGSVVAKACGSDGTTCGTVAITITAAVVPTEVVYINSAIANSGCNPPGKTGAYQCQITYGFDLNTPGNQHRLDPFYAGQDLNAAISPNGQTVAITRNDWSTTLGDTEVVTMPFAGGTPKIIKSGLQAEGISLTGINWKLDGSGFVLTILDETQKLCYVATLSADGSVFKQITATNMNCSATYLNLPISPSYLPDGRIVYAKADKTGGNPAAPYHIYVVSADGSTETDISNNATTGDMYPSPSPDGKQIVYRGPNGLALMNTDGTGEQLVPSQPAGDQPTWCHDGTIVYLSGGQLFSLDPGGSSKATEISTMGSTMYPYCR